MAERVGIGIVLDLLKTQIAGSNAAAIATAAVLYSGSPALCSERNNGVDLSWGFESPAAGDADSGLSHPEAQEWRTGCLTLERYSLSLWGAQAPELLLGEPKLKTVGSVFHYGNLAFTAARSLLLNLLPLWNEYFQAVENAEEEAFALGLEPPEEWPPWPWQKMEGAYWQSLWAALRDLTTFAVRRMYEAQAHQRAPRHIRNQLLADVRKTAIVLSESTLGYRYIPTIAMTAFKGNLLGAAADCTVSVGIDCYRVIIRPAYKTGRRPPVQSGAMRLGRITAANLLRCSTGLCAASLGVSLGAYTASCVRCPSVGATLGGTAAEFAWVLLVVAPLVNGWAYGPASPRPPQGAVSSAGATLEEELPDDDNFEVARQ